MGCALLLEGRTKEAEHHLRNGIEMLLDYSGPHTRANQNHPVETLELPKLTLPFCCAQAVLLDSNAGAADLPILFFNLALCFHQMNVRVGRAESIGVAPIEQH